MLESKKLIPMEDLPRLAKAVSDLTKIFGVSAAQTAVDGTTYEFVMTTLVQVAQLQARIYLATMVDALEAAGIRTGKQEVTL